MLTQTRLKELLNYDPETGLFTRKVTRKGAKAGDIAGHVNNHGYIVFWVDNKSYLAHRLAFLYMTGSWPKGQTHHINNDKTDNRIGNLADVTCRENNSNKQVHMQGKLVGTTFLKQWNKWRARITVDGILQHLGYFPTAELASKAYQSALNNLN